MEPPCLLETEDKEIRNNTDPLKRFSDNELASTLFKIPQTCLKNQTVCKPGEEPSTHEHRRRIGRAQIGGGDGGGEVYYPVQMLLQQPTGHGALVTPTAHQLIGVRDYTFTEVLGRQTVQTS